MRRIERVKGRSDDMLIIRGVNVFPSQIEAVLGQEPQLAPHYLLELRRPHSLDELDVLVEMRPELAGKLSADDIAALGTESRASDQGVCRDQHDGSRGRAGHDRALAGQGQARDGSATQGVSRKREKVVK